MNIGQEFKYLLREPINCVLGTRVCRSIMQVWTLNYVTESRFEIHTYLNTGKGYKILRKKTPFMLMLVGALQGGNSICWVISTIYNKNISSVII